MWKVLKMGRKVMNDIRFSKNVSYLDKQEMAEVFTKLFLDVKSLNSRDLSPKSTDWESWALASQRVEDESKKIRRRSEEGTYPPHG